MSGLEINNSQWSQRLGYDPWVCVCLSWVEKDIGNEGIKQSVAQEEDFDIIKDETRFRVEKVC